MEMTEEKREDEALRDPGQPELKQVIPFPEPSSEEQDEGWGFPGEDERPPRDDSPTAQEEKE